MNSLLNILPPEKRKILHNVYFLYFLKIIAEMLLVYIAIVAVFLIWARLVLENDYKIFESKTHLIETESKTINEQLMKINEALRQANIANMAYADWSEKLTIIYNTPNEGIILSALDINKKDEKITFQGRASTRQSLLNYQTNLENSGLIKNLEVPISVLTAKENIDFEIKGQINLK